MTRRVQQPRIEIYRDRGLDVRRRRAGLFGGWRWRLVARNGQILADSGESYTRKADVKRALGIVLEVTSLARIIEV